MSSTDVQKSGGNTNPLPVQAELTRARHFCFTEYKLENTPVFSTENTPLVCYAIYQTEACPTTGRLHHQGYVQLTKALTLKTLKATLSPSAKYLPCKGTAAQNIEYCSSTGKHCLKPRVDGPYEYGTPRKQGKRTDLHEVADAIADGYTMREMAEEFPVEVIKYHRGMRVLKELLAPKRDGKTPCEVLYITGKPGGGKSRLAQALLRGTNYYVKEGANKWWDGYDGERIVWIDEMRCTGSDSTLSLPTLLRWLDRYECRVEYKGGSCQLQATIFIVTSYLSIEEQCGIEDDAQLKRRITYTCTQ